jgi:iron complex outermembrane receptor protein
VNYGATVTGGVVTVTPSVSLQRAFVAPVPVEVNGVEGELGFDITRRWNVDFIASYALGKIKNGIVPCTDINSDGIPDNSSAVPTLAQLLAATGNNHLSTCKVTQRSSDQSPFSATITTEFTQPISSGTNGFLRGLLSLYGNSQGDPVYAFDGYKGYGLLNVFAGVRGSDNSWELTFFAKNVAGINKATTIFNGGPAQTSYQRLTLPAFTAVGQTFSSNYAQIASTPLREFGLTFRYALGSR